MKTRLTEEKIILDNVSKIFNKHKNKFIKNPKEKRLTEYEKAIGFTETSRIGAKQFANSFGYFMEDIYNLSNKFDKLKLGEKSGNDGENENEYFECKNRHDTATENIFFNF